MRFEQLENRTLLTEFFPGPGQGVGDMNGDGFDDYVTISQADEPFSELLVIRVYTGGPDGLTEGFRSLLVSHQHEINLSYEGYIELTHEFRPGEFSWLVLDYDAMDQDGPGLYEPTEVLRHRTGRTAMEGWQDWLRLTDPTRAPFTSPATGADFNGDGIDEVITDNRIEYSQPLASYVGPDQHIYLSNPAGNHTARVVAVGAITGAEFLGQSSDSGWISVANHPSRQRINTPGALPLEVRGGEDLKTSIRVEAPYAETNGFVSVRWSPDVESLDEFAFQDWGPNAFLLPFQCGRGRTPGDIDGDGEVGFTDFLELSRNFGATDAVFADGDLNCDGEVAFDDFLALAAAF